MPKSKYHDYSKRVGREQLQRRGVDVAPLRPAPDKFADYANTEKSCIDCRVMLSVGDFHVQTFTGNGGRAFRCKPCWEKTILPNGAKR